MSVRSDSLETLAVFLIDGSGLRVQDKGDCQEALKQLSYYLGRHSIMTYLDPLDLEAVRW